MHCTKAIGAVTICLLAQTAAWSAPSRQDTLGKFVVIGDSLSAGFQNFALYTSATLPGTPPGGQQYGFAQLVAQQAGADLKLPVVSYPGLPPLLTIDSGGQITRSTGLGTRVDPSVQTLNLSVPAYTVADALSKTINVTQVTDPTDALALTVLGYPGLLNGQPCGALAFTQPNLTISSVACAVQQQPQTVLVSLGSNDALQTLTFGAPPTSTDAFAASYHQMITALAGSIDNVIVTNIPDVTSIPYVWTASAFSAKCGSLPAGTSDSDYFVTNLEDATKSSGDVCTNYSVRSAALIQQAQAAVAAFNGIISREAAAVNATVVDINGLVANLAKNGLTVRQHRLTTAFGGGLFSLDGIHPTNTGYAVMANEVIQAMRHDFGMNVPLVVVEQVADQDPLVPPSAPRGHARTAVQ